MPATENPDTQGSARLERLLQERAKRLALRPEGSSEGQGEPVVVCALGQERYAIETRSLLEIVPFERSTPLPTAPGEVLGVMNVRGELRPVLSLMRLLGFPDSGPERDGYVLLVRGAQTLLGLRVDQVLGTESIEKRELTPLGQGSGVASVYLRGWTAKGLIFLETQAIAKWSLA